MGREFPIHPADEVWRAVGFGKQEHGGRVDGPFMTDVEQNILPQ